MSALTLTKIRIANGRWEGRIAGATPGEPPRIEVRHRDLLIDDVELTPATEPGLWHLIVPIPPHAIADGVQPFLIIDAADETRLGDFILIAGDPAQEDIQAELDLLRAELDLLKRAFRRHCREST